mgnify:FL=1
MAYLNKNDLVLIKHKHSETSIQARVVDIRWRRFRKNARDIARNPSGKKWKSVPYAVCEVFLGAPAGTEFIIAGYKLNNIDKNGDKMLVLHDKYIAEFDGEWAKKLIAESHEKRAQ